MINHLHPSLSAVTDDEGPDTALLREGLRIVRGFINEDLNGVICSHTQPETAPERTYCTPCRKLWRRAYAFEEAVKRRLETTPKSPLPDIGESYNRGRHTAYEMCADELLEVLGAALSVEAPAETKEQP